MLTWVLLTPNIEQGERFGAATLDCCWYILDGFESQKQCERAAARIRREAFRALEHLRQTGKLLKLSEYGDSLYENPPQASKARSIYTGRSRVRCYPG